MGIYTYSVNSNVAVAVAILQCSSNIPQIVVAAT